VTANHCPNRSRFVSSFPPISSNGISPRSVSYEPDRGKRPRCSARRASRTSRLPAPIEQSHADPAGGLRAIETRFACGVRRLQGANRARSGESSGGNQPGSLGLAAHSQCATTRTETLPDHVFHGRPRRSAVPRRERFQPPPSKAFDGGSFREHPATARHSSR
jgi:hypothetical protein